MNISPEKYVLWELIRSASESIHNIIDDDDDGLVFYVSFNII